MSKKNSNTKSKETGVLAEIVAALKGATKPERAPSPDALRAAYGAAINPLHLRELSDEWMGEELEDLARATAVLPSLLEAPAVRGLLESTRYVPDLVFTRPRLTFRPAPDVEHRNRREEYAVPEGCTLHLCELTGSAFRLPEGALCPILEYDSSDNSPHQEDREMWYYVVHPALVIEGPEAVLAALWHHVAQNVEKAAEAFLDAQQALQVAGAFDHGAAAENWPSRAFQTWKANGEQKHLVPSGFWPAKRKAA